MARDHKLAIQAHVLLAAEDLLHHAGRGGVARGVLDHAHAHQIAVVDLRVVLQQRENVVRNARVLGHHDAERLGHLEAPHDGLVVPHDHADDAAGRPSARPVVLLVVLPVLAVDLCRRHLDEVPVERGAHLRSRDEVLPFRRLHEAVAMRRDGKDAARAAVRATPRGRLPTTVVAPHGQPAINDWAVSSATVFCASSGPSPAAIETLGTTPTS